MTREDLFRYGIEFLPFRAHSASLKERRKACPVARVIVLISHLDARQEAAILAAANSIIGNLFSLCVAGLLRTGAASISVQ